MYQLYLITEYYITVISLHRVLAWQYHLQAVHIKLKVMYSKVHYIFEFYNLQYILLLIPHCVWIKYVNFVMYNSYVFKCVIVWQNSNRMYWSYILMIFLQSSFLDLFPALSSILFVFWFLINSLILDLSVWLLP